MVVVSLMLTNRVYYYSLVMSKKAIFQLLYYRTQSFVKRVMLTIELTLQNNVGSWLFIYTMLMYI